MQYLDNLDGVIYQETLMSKYRTLYENWGVSNLIFVYLNIAYIKNQHNINVAEHEEWKTICDLLISKWDDMASLSDPIFATELMSKELVEQYEIPELSEWEDDIVERASSWYSRRTA